jgi:hypothetical protein
MVSLFDLRDVAGDMPRRGSNLLGSGAIGFAGSGTVGGSGAGSATGGASLLKSTH